MNALCPGPVETPLLLAHLRRRPAALERRRVHWPTGRLAKPREIVNAALFLASDESSYVNGSTFLVDGGLTAAVRHAASSSAAVVEQVEQSRVAWVDTDAGGRIHFTAAFRWAEQAETALIRRLGISRLDLGRLSAAQGRGRVPEGAALRGRDRDPAAGREGGEDWVTYAWTIMKGGEPHVRGGTPSYTSTPRGIPSRSTTGQGGAGPVDISRRPRGCEHGAGGNSRPEQPQRERQLRPGVHLGRVPPVADHLDRPRAGVEAQDVAVERARLVRLVGNDPVAACSTRSAAGRPRTRSASPAVERAADPVGARGPRAASRRTRAALAPAARHRTGATRRRSSVRPCSSAR